MRFAYSSNAYRRQPIQEAIARIAALGYEGVELMADQPHVWPATVTSGEVNSIQESLNKHNVSLSNINAFMMSAVQDFWHPSWIEPDPAYRRLRVEHTIAALHLAKRIGAPCITTEPGGPLDPGLSREHALMMFREGLNEALAVAEQVDVQLLVEPEPGLLIENTEQFVGLATGMKSPMFGLNFDIGHFYCVGDDLPQSISRLASWIRHYHVEDIAVSRVHEHLVPGHGAIDFRSVMKAIGATGYDGWMTVELYPYLDDPDGAGREALAFMQRLA